MQWEYIILIVSIIILGFDLIWQAAWAGYFGPRTARKLILEDPKFLELQNTVTKLGKLTNISAEIQKIYFQIQKNEKIASNFTAWIKHLNSNVTAASNKSTEDLNYLYKRISGLLGQEMKQYKESLTETLPAIIPTPEDLDAALEQGLQLDPKSQEMLQEYNQIYQGAAVLVPEETADRIARGVSAAPKFLKKLVKTGVVRKIKEYMR